MGREVVTVEEIDKLLEHNVFLNSWQSEFLFDMKKWLEEGRGLSAKQVSMVRRIQKELNA